MKIREVSVQQINAALNDLTRDIDIKIKQIESLNNEIKNMQSKLEALTKAVNGDFTALDEAIGDNIEYINNNFVPNTRTVNGKALSSDITLNAVDVGAASAQDLEDAVIDINTALDSKLGAKTANGYVGMTDPAGADNVWIRTTSQGIIPYQSGGRTAGHNSIGTSSWYFANAYIQNVFVNKLNLNTTAGTQNGDIWYS